MKLTALTSFVLLSLAATTAYAGIEKQCDKRMSWFRADLGEVPKRTVVTLYLEQVFVPEIYDGTLYFMAGQPRDAENRFKGPAWFTRRTFDNQGQLLNKVRMKDRRPEIVNFPIGSATQSRVYEFETPFTVDLPFSGFYVDEIEFKKNTILDGDYYVGYRYQGNGDTCPYDKSTW